MDKNISKEPVNRNPQPLQNWLRDWYDMDLSHLSSTNENI